MDAKGHFYGTTPTGGTGTGCGSGCGTVFELTPGGGWTEKVLHEFTLNSGKDGVNPRAGLIFDAAGNLYGTTEYGGAYGGGTVFELLPLAGGRWTEKILYSFKVRDGGKDGIYPWAGLIFDSAGNLYGTTLYGGPFSWGTVFELTPSPGGSWTEKLLHEFGNGTDGIGPQGGLIFDTAGNLYGTTNGGGAYNEGTVFELSPAAGGSWTEKLIYQFNGGTDGGYPWDSLIFDAAGNLYGTSYFGGSTTTCQPSCGGVFELTPTAGGAWTKKVVYGFGSSSRDGIWPISSLVFDAAGNLYGTTLYGGDFSWGTVFKLTPSAGGWRETILHSFGSALRDGRVPWTTLILDAAGNLYATTGSGGTYGYGGPYGYGTVFEITP